MKPQNWLTELLTNAMIAKRPIALLHSKGQIVVYTRKGVTEWTFRLDDFTEEIQTEAIDIIYPAL